MTSQPQTFDFADIDLSTGRYEGFIFDCDGTLADTMPLHHEAWRHALRQCQAGFDFDWDLFVSRAGMSLERTVVELNAQFGTQLEPAQVAGAQRAYFESALHGVRPIEPVTRFAATVSQQYKVSVASGSKREHVLRTLELIGLLARFPIVVTPADVAHGKPAPDMFLLAAERMGVTPERCLVLEDSELGIVAARRAGMHAALVSTPRPTRGHAATEKARR